MNSNDDRDMYNALFYTTQIEVNMIFMGKHVKVLRFMEFFRSEANFITLDIVGSIPGGSHEIITFNNDGRVTENSQLKVQMCQNRCS